MAGLFSKIFGSKPDKADESSSEKLNAEFQSAHNPEDTDDRIGLAVLTIIQKQLNLLDFPLEMVPFNERFGSDKCRGALLGTAIAITQSEIAEPTNKDIIDTAEAVFALVYGYDIGPNLAVKTIEDSAKGNDVIAEASDWAIVDTKGVWSSGGTTSAAAFNLAANNMI